MASYSTESPTSSTWTHEYLQRSSHDESEVSELEAPLASVVRRKVSFADAFGLDLVSVKEFDNSVDSAEGREKEKLYLSCFFSVPASDEELEFRIGQNKLELERIELLPGSSTIHGIVRVLNLSYHKVIYVRTTLDGWQSYFDQLAEYVPGSSNGETDRFSFQLTLLPPFPNDGLRVEFCLCYESTAGIFWANNGGMNYVLFCYQRGENNVKEEKEEEKESESEENNQKGKKSCLKTSIKLGCADSKPSVMSRDLSEQETSTSVKKEKTQHDAENRSKNTFEESCKTLAERRNRRRASQLAYLQELFLNRDADAQLVQPSHAEKSKTGLNMLLPISQSSISVMSNISGTRQEFKILPDHQNTLTPVDGSRKLSSPPSSNTNTSEILSETTMDVLENKKSKDLSKELSDDAWEDFLNGVENIDDQKNNNALEQKYLLCIEGSNATQQSNQEYTVSNIEEKILTVRNIRDCPMTTEDGSHQCLRAIKSLASDHIDEVSSYDYSEKGQRNQEPEYHRGLGRPGENKAQHGKQQVSERSSNKDEVMLLSNQGEPIHAKDSTEQSNSKPEVTVLLEECTSCTSCVDMKLKAESHRVKDSMNVTKTGNKAFLDRKEFLAREQIDYIGEPMKKQKHIEEENENGSWREYSGEDLVVQEKRLQEDAKKPSHLKDTNTDKWTLSETSVVWDKGEAQKQVEYFNVCYGSVKEEFSDCSERQRREILSVKNKESKNDLKTEVRSTGEDGIDKSLHKLQNLMKTCLHPPELCTGSRTGSPSGHFNCTSSLSEDELLSPATYKGSEIEETLRYRIPQDRHGVGTEVPSSFSGTTSTSVSKLSSWLLICLAKISNLRSFAVAIVCVILFVIFVIAYLHDLSICLGIYLLSACWWCSQGIKRHVTKADSVD